MIKAVSNTPRVFKTGWFSKHATKIGVKDTELCELANELMQGLWDADLGGNVYKKRLNENRHRSIVISKTASYWIFTYLFAKADRDNISSDELKAFKKLAKDYATLSSEMIDAQVASNQLMEICNDCTNKVQK